MNTPRLPDPASAIRIVAHLIQAGCDCEPEITFRSNGTVGVAHDDWCALLLRMQVSGEPEITFWSRS